MSSFACVQWKNMHGLIHTSWSKENLYLWIFSSFLFNFKEFVYFIIYLYIVFKILEINISHNRIILYVIVTIFVLEL